MVKLAAVSLALLAVIAPLAAAKNCRRGLVYCGQGLLRKGDGRVLNALGVVLRF